MLLSSSVPSLARAKMWSGSNPDGNVVTWVQRAQTPLSRNHKRSRCRCSASAQTFDGHGLILAISGMQ